MTIANELTHPPRTMSEEAFLSHDWERRRVEWVDGEVVEMAPVGLEHGGLNAWLLHLLGSFLEATGDRGLLVSDVLFRIELADGRRLRAPDVLYFAAGRQEPGPDLVAEVAPDLAVEIVSASSEARDWREKHREYEAAGVREYWIIAPASGAFEVSVLNDKGAYEPTRIPSGQTWESRVLTGLKVQRDWLFAKPRPRVFDILRELGVLK